MKIGIMGGTFDPIHTGHLIVGETARQAAGLDEVWFMPTNVPPHKAMTPGASALQRWEMVNAALGNHPQFKACDEEINKGGTSYTIETIELLSLKYPNDEFCYIIGGDMVQYLPKWYRIDELIQMIRFIGVERPGIELCLSDLAPSIRDAVQIAEMPLIGISSTLIRERCRANQSIRYLVPDEVREIIERARLYETDGNG